MNQQSLTIEVPIDLLQLVLDQEIGRPYSGYGSWNAEFTICSECGAREPDWGSDTILQHEEDCMHVKQKAAIKYLQDMIRTSKNEH